MHMRVGLIEQRRLRQPRLKDLQSRCSIVGQLLLLGLHGGDGGCYGAREKEVWSLECCDLVLLIGAESMLLMGAHW